MIESNRDTDPGEKTTSQSDAWKEVGKQFETLGESLADAFRTAWDDEENRQKAREMRAGLESMINDVSAAIKDTADSPEGQHFRQEAQKTAESFRSAGEQTVQEVRPHLISALRQVNLEIQKMIQRMETDETNRKADSQDQGPLS